MKEFLKTFLTFLAAWIIGVFVFFGGSVFLGCLGAWIWTHTGWIIGLICAGLEICVIGAVAFAIEDYWRKN